MTARDLEALLDYSYWANERIFQVASRLSPEEFTRPVGPGYGSVRSTMLHVLSAEWGWLGRCGGGPERGPRLDPVDYPTLDILVARWLAVESSMRAFLGELRDDDLMREVRYPGADGTPCSMRIGELLHHTANHAVHHRGQVLLFLRQLGYTPPEIDLIYYLSGKRGVRAW